VTPRTPVDALGAAVLAHDGEVMAARAGPLASEQVTDRRDTCGEGAFADIAEPQDQLCLLCRRRGAAGAHAVEADGAGAGGGDDGLLVGRSAEVHDGVEAGRQAGHPGLGGVCGERCHQGGAPGRVGRPHPAQMPVEAPGLDHPRQGELVERGRPAVVQLLVRGDVFGEGGRAEHPAEAQRGREGLADGPHGDHAVGGEPLQGAHRLPVVAEFGVVVVLDDHGVPMPGPLDQREPPLR
jgi:hypothetical protein